MNSRAHHWPITDPSIPREDRLRIAGNRQLAGLPQGGRHSYADRRTAQHVVIFLTVIVTASLAMAVGELRELLFDRPATSLLAIAMLTVFAMAVPLLWNHDSPRRLTRLYRDRYVVPRDLDGEAHALLGRALQAADAVASSRIRREGLLDAVADNVLIPHRLWEIARLLRSHTVLRAEQAAVRGAAAVPDPRLQALRRSVAAVTQRVAELETYARLVQEADAMLHARRRPGGDDAHRDLLARPGGTSLFEHAAADESALAGSVRSAIAAGRALAAREYGEDGARPEG
ncbi:hypothetical protein [Planomonospora venezuelensis]|uniref:Uncharacterized protein n=1 Tax=Planomonospora venezuelensis TaxID=1999 RepID=A0A841DF02_PLAVE|nr:hypothetical protein [Planomonospora venezuelensis]MBB5965846.1 hypothetical protein [Planomonospora venezuelensis]GIN04040.1 hypothetical protein Pve01_56980 [Planomonospora venezuelensis]